MDVPTPAARVLAGMVALVAWAGLAAQFDASVTMTGSATAAGWAMLRYFTVLTNLLVALIFTAIAFGRVGFGGRWLLAGATLAILLVGVIYGLLLRGLVELSGGAKLADLLLHHATPILAPLFWLTCAPKGRLRRGDPLLWALFPLAYLLYALARGADEGFYAYPFIDVARIGWAQTAANVAAIAGGFILAGYVMVWLDGRLARRPERNVASAP